MSERVSQLAAHLNYPKGLLAGQTAIITGGGQGIGAEVARLFANEGAKVVISDIDAAKAHAVADGINGASPGRALAVPGDVLDTAYQAALVQRAADFGGGRLHVLVNNAGYTWDGVVHRLGDAQWEAMLRLHATAPFQLVRAAAPWFRVRDGAPRCVVAVSSVSGVHGNAGQANYAAAKAAVVGFTKALAKEWGPRFGVRANAVAFGRIRTRLTQPKENGAFVLGPGGERIAIGIPGGAATAEKKEEEEEDGEEGERYADIPLRRPGEPSEAAAAILAVASPLFSYVTGQTIMVTGGRNM